jgi:hypothetical protein
MPSWIAMPSNENQWSFMAPAQVRSGLSRAAAASASVILGLTLAACGSGDPSAPVDAPPTSSSDATPSDQQDSGDTADADRPDNLSDFPLPDTYTVVTSGSLDGAWTAILNVAADWEEMKAFYQDELPRAGWTLSGDRPFMGKAGTELDASKDDMEATVGVSSVDGKTSIVINVVKANY